MPGPAVQLLSHAAALISWEVLHLHHILCCVRSDACRVLYCKRQWAGRTSAISRSLASDSLETSFCVVRHV